MFNIFIDIDIIKSVFVAPFAGNFDPPHYPFTQAQAISTSPKVAQTLQHQEQKHLQVTPVGRHPQGRASLAVGLSQVREPDIMGNIHSVTTRYNVAPTVMFVAL